jgi:hypothetical protein
MDNEQYIELIEKYVDKTATLDEAKEFEKLHQEDAAFRELYKNIQANIAAIKNIARKEFLNELKRIDSQLPEINLKKNTTQHKVKWIGWTLAAAACLTGLILLTNYLRPNQTNKLYEQTYAVYYQPYRNLISSYNRSDEKTTTLKEQAMNSYTVGDYAKTIELLKEIKPTDQDAAYHFYLANAYMAVGKIDEARENFLWVLKADILFIDQTKWFLALSYIKTNQIDEAKKFLNDLINHENVYKNRAIEILNTYKSHY